MVGLFRKTATEPELGDRIAGLTRRRGVQPVAPADEVSSDTPPVDAPARSVPSALPSSSAAASSPTAEQPFALAARPAPAIVVEPAGQARPEAPRIDAPRFES